MKSNVAAITDLNAATNKNMTYVRKLQAAYMHACMMRAATLRNKDKNKYAVLINLA